MEQHSAADHQITGQGDRTPSEAPLLTLAELPADYRNAVKSIADGLPQAWCRHTDDLLALHRWIHPDRYSQPLPEPRLVPRLLLVFRARVRFHLDDRTRHPLSGAEDRLYELSHDIDTAIAEDPTSPELRGTYRTLGDLRDSLSTIIRLRRTALAKGWTDETRREFETHCRILAHVLGNTHPFIVLLERACAKSGNGAA